MATIPTSTLLINNTTAEYVAEWLVAAIVDDLYESTGSHDAYEWTRGSSRVTFKIVKVTAGEIGPGAEEVLSIHLVTLASGHVEAAFHEESTGADEAIAYVRGLLSRRFSITAASNEPNDPGLGYWTDIVESAEQIRRETNEPWEFIARRLNVKERTLREYRRKLRR